MLYAAWKRGLPRKFARSVLFRLIKKRSFNLLCVLDLFSERWQSILFQIFFFFLGTVSAPLSFGDMLDTTRNTVVFLICVWQSKNTGWLASAIVDPRIRSDRNEVVWSNDHAQFFICTLFRRRLPVTDTRYVLFLCRLCQYNPSIRSNRVYTPTYAVH